MSDLPDDHNPPEASDPADRTDHGPLPLDDEGSDADRAPDEPAAGETPAAPVVPATPPAPEPARPSPTHVRAFLAVNFPVHVVRRVADEVASLRGPVAAAGLKASWVPAANLHVTLKFLGPTKVAALEAVAARLAAGLSQAGRGLGPFDVEARGLGAFPSTEGPRVLWVGVTGSPVLAALQQEVESWMAELGFPREERAFHPHLTIGRVTGGQGDLSALFAERASRSYGGGRVGEIVLYESRTVHKGAEYHALDRVPLPRS